MTMDTNILIAYFLVALIECKQRGLYNESLFDHCPREIPGIDNPPISCSEGCPFFNSSIKIHNCIKILQM